MFISRAPIGAGPGRNQAEACATALPARNRHRASCSRARRRRQADSRGMAPFAIAVELALAGVRSRFDADDGATCRADFAADGASTTWRPRRRAVPARRSAALPRRSTGPGRPDHHVLAGRATVEFRLPTALDLAGRQVLRHGRHRALHGGQGARRAGRGAPRWSRARGVTELPTPNWSEPPSATTTGLPRRTGLLRRTAEADDDTGPSRSVRAARSSTTPSTTRSTCISTHRSR